MLSRVHGDGEEGIARSKSVTRGIVLNPCTSSGGLSEIYCDLPEPFPNRMPCLSKVNAMHHEEGTVNVFQHLIKVGGVSGRCSVTKGPYSKSYHSFA